MAYVGTPIDTTNTFQSLTGDRFDGDGSAVAFTLSTAPASTLDIEVFVGNVRQDPNSAYKSDSQNISGARTHTGAITANAGITMGGTTPTLTIGDAGAEDAKLVFDGNAQDYHIGLDDTDDSLKIGLGSTLGTTSHIVIDSTGAVTKPLQPAFSAQANADLTNIATNNAFNTIKNGTEIFDLNGDYNTSTFAFTAPVTGKYMLTFSATLTNVDTNATYIVITIVTSNRNYADSNTFGINGYSADEARVEVSQTVLADMDASDTAVVQVKQHEGTAQMDVTDDTCHFSGYLAC